MNVCGPRTSAKPNTVIHCALNEPLPFVYSCRFKEMASIGNRTDIVVVKIGCTYFMRTKLVKWEWSQKLLVTMD